MLFGHTIIDDSYCQASPIVLPAIGIRYNLCTLQAFSIQSRPRCSRPISEMLSSLLEIYDINVTKYLYIDLIETNSKGLYF